MKSNRTEGVSSAVSEMEECELRLDEQQCIAGDGMLN